MRAAREDDENQVDAGKYFKESFRLLRPPAAVCARHTLELRHYASVF